METFCWNRLKKSSEELQSLTLKATHSYYTCSISVIFNIEILISGAALFHNAALLTMIVPQPLQLAASVVGLTGVGSNYTGVGPVCCVLCKLSQDLDTTLDE